MQTNAADAAIPGKRKVTAMPDMPGERIPSTVFRSAGATPDAQFRSWSESIGVIFEVERAETDKDKPFSASVRSHHFGSLLLSTATAPRQRFQRTPRQMAADGLDLYCIQLLNRGSVHSYEDGDEQARPGDVYVFDLSRELNTWNTDFSAPTLLIPRSALAPALLRPDHQHGRTLRRESPLGAMLANHLRELDRTASTFDRTSAESIVAPTLSLAASALNARADGPVEDQIADLSRIDAIRRFIDDHIADPDLGPRRIEAEFPYSRATLYRMFEPMDGIANFIRNRRLRLSLSRLRDPRYKDLSIASIAHDCGFSNESGFSRAFKAKFGITARSVRSLSVDAVRSMSFDGDRYEAWIRNLR